MKDDDIRKALADIAELKKSVRGNMKIMRPILLDRAFVSFSYFGAVFFAACFASLHFAIRAYGTFDSIPPALKAAMAALFVVLLIPFTVIKTRIITRNLKKQNRSLSVWDLFLTPEFRNFYLLILYGAVLTASLCVSIGGRTGDWWIFLPAFALFFAFVLGLFALLFSVGEYMIISAVSALFGLASLFFMTDSQLLWLAVYGALVSGAFGAVLQFAKASHE